MLPAFVEELATAIIRDGANAHVRRRVTVMLAAHQLAHTQGGKIIGSHNMMVGTGDLC